MGDGPSCPKCGTVLYAEALGGLCRRCLGRLAFIEDPNPSNGAGTVAPGRFGDYELIEEIARGGMGVVYRARQISLDRVVAVKMVLNGAFSSLESQQRFRLEAQAAARLHHPNIVPIYEVGQLDGQHYFSMEFIEGKHLGELVRDHPLPAGRAAGYVEQIACAMHYAHQSGILHRDLKPSNVLLDTFDQPRITDFGLAKLTESDTHLTLTGQALGSPGHMPPEQAAGKHESAGPAADVYSLGAVLYHLVTGRPPFQGETLPAILLQVQRTDPVPPGRLNPSVPRDLETICLKCLQKDPQRRYPSAQALADDLNRFRTNRPIEARPIPALEKLWLWCRRHPTPAALSAGLSLAILLGLLGILWEWRRAERHADGETKQRRLTEDYAHLTRLNLYAADISLAAQAIKAEEEGRARQTLAALVPKPGEEDLRGFEWRYLWNLCQGDQMATLTGHTWIVTCAAFSPNNRWIVSGSQDGAAKIWDAETHRSLASLDASNGSIWSVAFSPDSKELMTAGREGVKFRETRNWGLVTNLPGQLGSLSQTGTLVAVAESSPFFWEAAGRVTVRDYRTWKTISELPEPGRASTFSPDNRLLAVAGQHKGVDLYELPSGALVRHLPTEEAVWSMVFSPDGSRLLACGWSKEIEAWRIPAWEPLPKLKGHLRTVWSAAYSPDGRTVFTASSDQTLRAWDATTFQPKGVLRGHDSEVWCVAFSPDGEWLVSGSKDQTVRIWPTKPKSPSDHLPHAGERVVFSPDGTRFLLVKLPGDRAGTQLWNAQTRKQLADLPTAYAAGFSEDGKKVVWLDEVNGGLRSWPEASLTKLESWNPDSTPCVISGFSPQFDFLFSLDARSNGKVWEASTGKLVASIKVPAPPIRSAVLGPGGRHLALSLERENSVFLFNVALGSRRELIGHRDFVSGLAFSPNGSQLATGSMDGTIRLWSVDSGAELAVLPGHVQEATDVGFSSDGRTLASVCRTDAFKLWHLATRRELLTVPLPQAGNFLQFSPDGTHLAVSGLDENMYLYEAPDSASTSPAGSASLDRLKQAHAGTPPKP